MKTLKKGVQWDIRIQQLKKVIPSGSRFTSAHLLTLAFAIIMVFGCIMKMIAS
ncbi:hypothetical protein [Flavobacterium sp. AG291]|uniref:hypothetical protein n=1 Tax=Flavobacterium sp. AG291 TaxID=2184000 RepID=UPI000E2BF2C1|nr:hypothetical protein [Flavobacterium sp. AG291]RDI06697.1 hypothetical protein DEU42_11442 [Flavobacterium sp. AG291]